MITLTNKCWKLQEKHYSHSLNTSFKLYAYLSYCAEKVWFRSCINTDCYGNEKILNAVY